jgi:hypothetical protein
MQRLRPASGQSIAAVTAAGKAVALHAEEDGIVGFQATKGAVYNVAFK